MKKIFLYSLILISFIPLISSAAPAPTTPTASYTLLEPLPRLDGSGGTTATMDLNGYIGYIFKFAIALAAFLAVIMIIKGGFEYIISETPFGKSNGRETITNALVGLLMVLASFLILQTIDPRLVEIETSIPAIKISDQDLKAVTDFQTQLGTDLRTLSAETQAQTNAAVTKKNELATELAQVNDSIANNQSLSPSERYQLEVKKADLEQQIRDESVAISKNVATVIGQTSFAKAYDSIKKPDENSASVLANYTAPVVTNKFNVIGGEYRTAANTVGQANPVTNVIQDQYNTAINNILKSTESEAQKIAEIDTFEKQRDFYITAIKEEETLTKYINSYEKTAGTNYGSFDKDPITKSLAIYEANLANPQKLVESGLPAAEYNKIMQARIDAINTSLGKK